MTTDKQTKKTHVALLSTASNSVLVAAKLVVGIITGSVAIISEAIHSAIDLVAVLIALFAIKKSSEPADDDHPYGHGKFENISGAVEALLIFLAAVWIIYEAVGKILHPEPMGQALLGVLVMLISVICNIIVSKKLFKVGTETDSMALIADGWHLCADVYTSTGVSIALVIVWFGANFYNVDLRWVDPAVAILVALIIIKAAYDLTIESIRVLLDVHLPPDEIALVRKIIEKCYPKINGYHQLRTRKSGSFRFIEFHIKVAATLRVAESHKIGQDLITEIKNTFADASTTIHIEPCDGNCTENCTDRCRYGCLLPKQKRLSGTCSTVQSAITGS